MDLYNEIDGCMDGAAWDDLLNFDCPLDSYQDLQSRYTELHKTYLKEIENSKNYKQKLEKCLQYYSKLCKKFDAQQKVINKLEKEIQENMNLLKESYMSQEKLQGLIGVYQSERSLYSGETNYFDLKRDKEMLLDLCCQLISESVKTNNTRNITNIILRKFKKDLNKEKLILLKGRQVAGLSKEICKIKDSPQCSPKHDAESFNLVNATSLVKSSQEQTTPFEVKEETNTSPSPCAMFGKSEETQDESESVTEKAKEFLEFAQQTENYLPSSPEIHHEDGRAQSKDLHASLPEISEGQNRAFNETGDGGTVKHGGNETCGVETDEASPCLPFIGTCAEVISESKGVDASHFESSESLMRSDPNCDTLANTRNTTFKENSHVELYSAIVAPSVCSDRARDTEGENVFNTSSEEELLPEKAIQDVEEKESGASRRSTGCNDSDLSSETVEGISLLHINDCDSSENKETPILAEKQDVTPTQGVNIDEEPRKDPNSFSIFNGACTENEPISREVDRRGNGDVGKSSDGVEVRTRSIFDLSPRTEIAKRVPEYSSEVFEVAFGQKQEDDTDSCLKEEKLVEIFSEMTSVRLLSPIRDIPCKKRSLSPNERKGELLPAKVMNFSSQASPSLPPIRMRYREQTEKTRVASPVDVNRNKKVKLAESGEEKDKEKKGSNFLDSILSAMSIQNEEMKANEFHEGDLLMEKLGLLGNGPSRIRQTNSQSIERQSSGGKETKTGKEEKRNGISGSFCEKGNSDRLTGSVTETALEKTLRTFVSSQYSNKEETDKSVKDCILVLANSTDEAIARVIVAIVFENVNEKVEVRDRPVPPLTKTQNYLIILLSVLKSQNSVYENLAMAIRSMISQKLYPDVFHWPDDSVESASRFYAALCKHNNDVKGFWKFCLQAMEEMKQRCCIVVLAALQTWPDTLFQASSKKNNVLVVTAVNLFLHMPKGNRNPRQEKKLLSLKHLLQDFYGFHVEDTIENYAGKLIDSFLKDEEGAHRSVILLSKSRDIAWTGKHVLPKLLVNLKSLSGERGDEDETKIGKILNVLDELVPNFFNASKTESAEAVKTITCLAEILTSNKFSHESERDIVEILLSMKQYPSARKTISEWIPKKPIDDRLRNAIINTSMDGILWETKFNRKDLGFGGTGTGGGDGKRRGKKGKKTKKGKKGNKGGKRRVDPRE